MIYERDIYTELLEHLNLKQATVITGIRRAGKTTLLNSLYNTIPSNKLFLDLEMISNRELFDESNYENIVRRIENLFGIDFTRKSYIALDEIQFVKNLPSIIKFLYDHYNIKFLLTGSSSYYLKNLFTESLAGRKRIFELYTLSFGEYLKFKEVDLIYEKSLNRKYDIFSHGLLKDYYEEFIKFGGFPDVVLAKKSNEKIELLKDILNSYLMVDIKELSDFDNVNDIYKFMKIVASRAGNKTDISNMSKDSGIAWKKVSNLIELFEGTYLLKRIYVLTKNPEREIKKTPKLYFHDNGLLNVLSERGSGTQFENSVFNQLKNFGEINYYQLKTGREIDFILNGKTSYEVKERCGDFDIKRLNRLSDNLAIPERKLIFRYPPPDEKNIGENYTWGGDIR